MEMHFARVLAAMYIFLRRCIIILLESPLLFVSCEDMASEKDKNMHQDFHQKGRRRRHSDLSGFFLSSDAIVHGLLLSLALRV